MTEPIDILLINRDKYFLSQMTRALQEEGFTIHTAMEMGGALSILSRQRIQLIICDKELQDVGGSEFLSFLKKDPLREVIPFMFLVSLNDQGRPRQFFQLGAVDYVVHPMDTAALTERINAALHADAREPVASPPRPIAHRQSVEVDNENPAPVGTSFAAPLKVEASRDGVIWLPSTIIEFKRQGITMETAMMGKPGISLMIRIRQPEGAFILNGTVRDISFNDFQKPAGLEIEVRPDDNWRRIQTGILPETSGSNPASALQDALKLANPAAVEAPASFTAGQSVGTTKQTAAQVNESSYEKRFYQSLIGKQLDNYRAISLIGTGNMGGVLRGWDVALEREVALKIISYKLSSKESFRELFIKEARVISKLNHPHIAQIYHIGSSNEILYYAMELIDGITLKDVIARDKQVNVEKGMAYLQSVCQALEIVYQNSIVHRDIKPANLVISHAGIIKVVDFGVAKMHDARSGSAKKGLVGTPLYMSPEQIAGLAIDHRSDMYSLGATFYHAFSGAPPFKAHDVKVLLSHHVNTPLTPLSAKNPKVPAALSRVIEKMMAKDPLERFNSFQEVVEQLMVLQ